MFRLSNHNRFKVATSTDTSSQIGNGILYEVAKSIVAIEAESGLRVRIVYIKMKPEKF